MKSEHPPSSFFSKSEKAAFVEFTSTDNQMSCRRPKYLRLHAACCQLPCGESASTLAARLYVRKGLVICKLLAMSSSSLVLLSRCQGTGLRGSVTSIPSEPNPTLFRSTLTLIAPVQVIKMHLASWLGRFELLMRRRQLLFSVCRGKAPLVVFSGYGAELQCVCSGDV